MTARQRTAMLTAALLTAGCASAPAIAPTDDPLHLGDAVSPRYTAQAVHLDDVAISRVEASSTRPTRWFSAGNLTDGNLHSAWGPQADDPAPTLLVTLTRPTTLKALGLKVSDRDITFDVATATTEGGFTTIASGIHPDYTSLDLIDVPDTEAIQVKLTFHVPADRQLLVCELQVFNAEGAITAPAPSATPAPSDSHHFYVEGDSFGAVWGPFRLRPTNNTFKLTFKSHWPEAQTRFRARVKTGDGVTVTTFDYDTFKNNVYYARNYSLYGGFEVGGDGWATSYLGQDLYFEVLEATGYFQFIVADDNGYVLDYAR